MTKILRKRKVGCLFTIMLSHFKFPSQLIFFFNLKFYLFVKHFMVQENMMLVFGRILEAVTEIVVAVDAVIACLPIV